MNAILVNYYKIISKYNKISEIIGQWNSISNYEMTTDSLPLSCDEVNIVPQCGVILGELICRGVLPWVLGLDGVSLRQSAQTYQRAQQEAQSSEPGGQVRMHLINKE